MTIEGLLPGPGVNIPSCTLSREVFGWSFFIWRQEISTHMWNISCFVSLHDIQALLCLIPDSLVANLWVCAWLWFIFLCHGVSPHFHFVGLAALRVHFVQWRATIVRHGELVPDFYKCPSSQHGKMKDLKETFCVWNVCQWREGWKKNISECK